MGGEVQNSAWLGLGIALSSRRGVVHRAIKSSNVMLDSNYNAKLGDFSLARLVDHELGSQIIVLAGTTCYLTPECVTTGKGSKESNTYSFSFVALEITCGRRPVELKWEPSRVRLIDWVWDLYGQGQILEAANKSNYGIRGESTRAINVGWAMVLPPRPHYATIDKTSDQHSQL